jgi:hypothetical protein
LCPISTKFGNARQIFLNVYTVKFHGKPPSESHADTLEQTDGWADMTKIIGTFRDYANTPKNENMVFWLRIPKSRVLFWRTGRDMYWILHSTATLLKDLVSVVIIGVLYIVVRFPGGHEIYLIFKASGPVLWPTQPLFNEYWGIIPWR